MQLLFLVVSFLLYVGVPERGVSQAISRCEDPAMRALIKTAVEEEFVLHGIPAPAPLFKMLDHMKKATTPQTTALASYLRKSSSAEIIDACEVNEPELPDPLFITFFFGGADVQQPSALVMNFGLPGMTATVGRLPKD